MQNYLVKIQDGTQVILYELHVARILLSIKLTKITEHIAECIKQKFKLTSVSSKLL